MTWLALILALLAQASETAIEKTTGGDLSITPIKHGTLMLEFGGKVIHVDPWSQADLSRYPKADWIFVTDIHGDHHDPKGIDAVRKAGTKFVAPAAVAQNLPEAVVLKNGESRTFDGIPVEAVPMYNLRTNDPTIAQKMLAGTGIEVRIGPQ